MSPIRKAMATTVAKLKVSNVAIAAFVAASERFTLTRLKMPIKMPMMESTLPYTFFSMFFTVSTFFNVGHIICQSRLAKIPEKLGAKPLFGDFTLELLIRFERTTCSLRVSCSTG